MKIKNIFLTSIASLILMAYGWYLGQLHQSGYDVAGIFLFFTGVTGFVLALLIRYFTQRYSWHNIWYVNILTGVISCSAVFVLVLVFARLHG
jgi:Na+/H+-translocating membrane pyrophosphatase